MGFLRVQSLNKIYNEDKPEEVRVHALKNIDLDINQGDFIVISGPSGSGKTTFLNMVGGLDSVSSGQVFLEDVDITKLNERQLTDIRLHKMGFIFQAYNLIPVLSAMENIEYAMMLQGMPKEERREKAQKLADHLGIGDLLNKKPNEISGGQQQRVAVARSIVSEPMLVLADEPTANLDSETGSRLIDLMKEMNHEKKITFIFSTHDQMVMDKAERRIVLRDGKVISDQKNNV
ncbi:MAG: ABC transporter ATP-binding protein [Candidatus Margulisbacteria bacterium]|nr:ABC transporter ATP-binding protein [Candidatus Margulisiibacteriota bacterium]